LGSRVGKIATSPACAKKGTFLFLARTNKFVHGTRRSGKETAGGIIMAKEKITRRQKDVSRLLREKKLEEKAAHQLFSCLKK